MDTFTVNYMENVEHAHAVDTRPSLTLPPIRRPGDKANKDHISSPLSTELPPIVRVHDYAPASIFCMILDCMYSKYRAPSDDN